MESDAIVMIGAHGFRAKGTHVKQERSYPIGLILKRTLAMYMILIPDGYNQSCSSDVVLTHDLSYYGVRFWFRPWARSALPWDKINLFPG